MVARIRYASQNRKSEEQEVCLAVISCVNYLYTETYEENSVLIFEMQNFEKWNSEILQKICCPIMALLIINWRLKFYFLNQVAEQRVIRL